MNLRVGLGLLAGSLLAWVWLLLPLVGGTRWAVNGLDVPLIVTCDAGGSDEVPPGEAVRLSRPAVWGPTSGVSPCRATLADGTVVDEVLLPYSFLKEAVFNPLGAAPLYHQELVYSASGGEPSPDPVLLAGRAVWIGDADYCFEDPPEEVRLSNHESAARRTRIALVPGGWRQAAMLVPADAVVPLVQGVRDAESSDEAAWSDGGVLVGFHLGPRQLARVTPAPFPDSASAARLRAAVAASPTDPQLRVKLSQQVSLAEALDVLQAGLAAQPDEPTLTRELAGVLTRAGRPVEALALYDRLPPDPEDDRSLALALVGRAAEGAATIPADASPDQRIFQARLLALAGTPLPDKAPRDLLNARQMLYSGVGGLPTLEVGLDEEGRAAIRREWWAIHDPARAWPLFQDVDASALWEVPSAVRILLGLEFWRAGDPLTGQILLESVGAGDLSHWAAILDPDAPLPPWVERASGAGQGVVQLVRARVLAAHGRSEEAAAALARVPLLETVPGVANIAAREWPAVGGP